MVACDGETVMLSIGTTVTMMTAVPDFPSLDAVMVDWPAPSPTTSPVEETVEMELSLELQAIVRPVSTFPAPSTGMARSWRFWETMTVPVGGVIEIDAIGTGTAVTDAVPAIPSVLAEMVAAPAARAVTTPVELTVAIALFDDDQLKTFPGTKMPPASSA